MYRQSNTTPRFFTVMTCGLLTAFVSLSTLSKNNNTQALSTSSPTYLECEKKILDRLSGQPLKYLAKSNSMVAKAERRLEPKQWQQENGKTTNGWKLSTSSRWMFIKINEESEFTWPSWDLQKYEMKRKGLSKSKNFRLDRNDKGDVILTKHKEQPKAISLPTPAFDPLNYQLRLQLDLACKEQTETLTYPLVKRDAIKPYHFKIINTETVETEAGKFDSLLLEKVEEKEGRQTQIWFAKDYDYTLLKLAHLEKERLTVLELQEKPEYWLKSKSSNL